MIDTRKIKARIVEKNTTQGALAAKMGLAQTSLSCKLCNRRPMTLDEAEILQRELEIPDAEFRSYFFASEVA